MVTKTYIVMEGDWNNRHLRSKRTENLQINGDGGGRNTHKVETCVVNSALLPSSWELPSLRHSRLRSQACKEEYGLAGKIWCNIIYMWHEEKHMARPWKRRHRQKEHLRARGLRSTFERDPTRILAVWRCFRGVPQSFSECRNSTLQLASTASSYNSPNSSVIITLPYISRRYTTSEVDTGRKIKE
jgi:hypothetical protein